MRLIDFTVLVGKEFNPVKFNTVQNIAYITSGVGQFLIFGEDGIKATEVKAKDSITIAEGILEVLSVTKEAELKIFASLSKSGQLGSGECSAIAVVKRALLLL